MEHWDTPHRSSDPARPRAISPAVAGPAATGSGRALIDWTLALQERLLLETALGQFLAARHVECALVTRYHNAQQQARIAALSDRRAAAPPRSVAHLVLGSYTDSALPASIWRLSDYTPAAGTDGADWLRHWQRERGVHEIVVIALATDHASSDFLELHLTRALLPEENDHLAALAADLTHAWRMRRAGTITKLLRARNLRAEPAPHDDPLGADNPANLTRSELRTCLLVKRGLRPRAISRELGVSESTVRTHLRSIYSKLDVDGQVELAYSLNRGFNGRDTGGFPPPDADLR